jgi:hypothetical protein
VIVVFGYLYFVERNKAKQVTLSQVDHPELLCNRALIDEFAEDGRHLIRGHNKANAHTQNESEGQRADKFTSDNAKGLRDPLFEVKRITDHSHNIRAPSSTNSSML